METDPLQEPREPVAPNDAPEIKNPTTQGPSEVVSHIPQSPPNPPKPYDQRGDHTPTWKKVLEYIAVAIALGLLVVNIFQMHYTGKAAEAAKSASETAHDTLIATERPWVKIKQRIISPLTFNVGGRASGIPIAMMTVEDTIENVGQTVAVNVLSWEDVIPVDLDHSIRTARARQKEYCDANRHPDPRGLSGYTLFPHDPSIGKSIVGPQMPKVEAATIRNK